MALCRDLKLFSQAVVAIDGSKFKAVNTRDKNFTEAKIAKRQQQIEESIERYLKVLETADRTQPAELEATTTRLQPRSNDCARKCGSSTRSKLSYPTHPMARSR